MTAPLLFQHVVCPVAGSRHAVMSVVVVVVLLLVVEVLVVVVEVLAVVVVEVLAVVVVEVLAVVVVVGVVVVVVLLPPGGVTLSAKVPLAPPYPSTMMKYVCPAVTVGVIREARSRPLELTHASSLHPTSAPPAHTPLRR